MAKFWFCLFVCLSAAGFLTISGKKEGKDKTSKKPVHIYEVKPNELEDIIESNEEVLVLFYDSKDVKSKPIISKLDKLDFDEFDIPVVKVSTSPIIMSTASKNLDRFTENVLAFWSCYFNKWFAQIATRSLTKHWLWNMEWKAPSFRPLFSSKEEFRKNIRKI